MALQVCAEKRKNNITITISLDFYSMEIIHLCLSVSVSRNDIIHQIVKLRSNCPLYSGSLNVFLPSSRTVWEDIVIVSAVITVIEAIS